MSVAVEQANAQGEVAGRQIATAIIASSLGWSLDLFDLFILLYVAPVVGRLFFPSDYPTLSLAAVYASFAVTLLMRPVGSALFGSYADKNGRKGAMILAVTGVGVATAAFGLLPTINQIGTAAPILFLLLRLVQGVFVGGVVASTHTIGTESVAPKWRGLLSGFIGVGGAGIGSLLASLVYFAVSAFFTGDAFDSWGWRFMFFAGILSSVLGVFIFNTLEESPIWKRMDAANAGARAPLRTLFTPPHSGKLFTNLLITTGGGIGYYLTSGYIPTFYKVVNHLPNSTASVLLIAGSITTVIASILVGHLSEMIGRKKTFILVSAVSAVALPVCYLGLGATQDLTAITVYSMVIAFLGSAGVAPILIFCNERFPTVVRASGTGLSWNIGFALGGTMPTFVSLASGTLQGIPGALAAFLGAGFLVYLLGALLVPETRGDFT